MANVIAQQEEIPAELIAPFRDSTALLGDSEAIGQRLDEDGYLYVNGYFPRDDVIAARTDIFGRLAEVGEIRQPAVEGIYTGQSQRQESVDDLGCFWRSVSESWSLRRLSHGRALHQLMASVLGGPARVQDYIFLRPANRGKYTHIHCDYPFFTRATEAVATAWIALGDVPTSDGPLFIVEGSHRFADVIEDNRGFDVSADKTRQAAYPQTPLQLARERGTRLLTQDFSAGDVVIFPMFTLHGALDNVSPIDRVRLSCDVRYQLASAELDPRYFGTNPTGTTGAGYAELVGAKPLTEAWHVR